MPAYRLKRPVINGQPTQVWYVVWAEGRRSHRVSTKTTDKVAAEKFLRQFEAIEAAPPEKFTVGDLCDAYQKEREADPKVKYPKAIANSLTHIRRHFGPLPPSMISRATVRSYIAQRRKLVMDATIDKELRFLRQALKFGVREGWTDKEPHVETPGGSPARQRFLTRDEFARLWFQSSPLHLRVFLGLAIDTLARGKHILALTWDQVDFDRKIIWYKPADVSSKKKTQAAPISDRLLPLLERAFEAREAYDAKGKERPLNTVHVIEWNGRRLRSIRKAFEGAVERAGLENCHKHDIRRTGASWAIQDGASFDAVAALLGDTVEMTQKTYAVFSPTYLRDVVDSIASGQGGLRA